MSSTWSHRTHTQSQSQAQTPSHRSHRRPQQISDDVFLFHPHSLPRTSPNGAGGVGPALPVRMRGSASEPALGAGSGIGTGAGAGFVLKGLSVLQKEMESGQVRVTEVRSRRRNTVLVTTTEAYRMGLIPDASGPGGQTADTYDAGAEAGGSNVDPAERSTARLVENSDASSILASDEMDIDANPIGPTGPAIEGEAVIERLRTPYPCPDAQSHLSLDLHLHSHSHSSASDSIDGGSDEDPDPNDDRTAVSESEDSQSACSTPSGRDRPVLSIDRSNRPSPDVALRSVSGHSSPSHIITGRDKRGWRSPVHVPSSPTSEVDVIPYRRSKRRRIEVEDEDEAGAEADADAKVGTDDGLPRSHIDSPGLANRMGRLQW